MQQESRKYPLFWTLISDVNMYYRNYYLMLHVLTYVALAIKLSHNTKG